MLSQEAHVLEAREGRRVPEERSTTNFWIALREEWSCWESCLDALLQEEHPHSASHMKESMEKLDILLADLQNLCRQSQYVLKNST
jgi:hypothetical protein